MMSTRLCVALLLSVLGAGLLAGCSSLPATGPTAAQISEHGATPQQPAGDYLILTLDEDVARIVGPWHSRIFADMFKIRSGPRSLPIGIGDGLDIRVLEAGDNGLFANTQTRGAQLQTQVDESGYIFVPFVGRVRAAGLTPEALRRSIQTGLEDKAIQPQVLVQVTSQQANSVTVVGDVGKPGRYPLSVAGTRLLDMVAIAGGARNATYDTLVTLKRGGKVGVQNIEDLFVVPENNVYLSANDEVLLTFSPRSYTILGAVGLQKQQTFDTKTVTLAEAVARAGGLATELSDPSGVFVFRLEEPSLIRALRPDIQPPPTAPVATVYRLDLRSPKGLFLARAMQVRDKDVVYVATAPAVEFSKFLVLVGQIASTVRSGTGIANDIKTLRN